MVRFRKGPKFDSMPDDRLCHHVFSNLRFLTDTLLNNPLKQSSVTSIYIVHSSIFTTTNPHVGEIVANNKKHITLLPRPLGFPIGRFLTIILNKFLACTIRGACPRAHLIYFIAGHNTSAIASVFQEQCYNKDVSMPPSYSKSPDPKSQLGHRPS
jgi:hypothetical protein